MFVVLDRVKHKRKQLGYIRTESEIEALLLEVKLIKKYQPKYNVDWKDDKNYLYIKKLTVDEGIKLKRYKPKGFSLMMPIQKKTSHVSIVLEELPENRKKKKEEALARMPKIEEIKKFIVEVVKLLAWFQHRFVYIHPFQDYNGRTVL